MSKLFKLLYLLSYFVNSLGFLMGQMWILLYTKTGDRIGKGRLMMIQAEILSSVLL